MAFVPKSEFRPDMLLTAPFTPKAEEILDLTQVLFWFKTINLIKLAEEVKIMEAYVKFVISFFKPFTLEGLDKETDSVIKSIWKINYVNENYKSVESYCKTNSDKSQQWMVVLLGVLQDSYYEVSKTYSRINTRKYGSVWENLHQLVTDEKNYYNQLTNIGSFKLDIRKIYPKSENFIMSALSNCTSNLLNHVFFRNHPRAFLSRYITSLNLHMSLESKQALDNVAAWIDKAADKNALSYPFLEIFKLLCVYKVIYWVRMKNIPNAILALMELVNKRYKQSGDSSDYLKSQEFIRMLTKEHPAPMVRTIEKQFWIDNGMITIDE